MVRDDLDISTLFIKRAELFTRAKFYKTHAHGIADVGGSSCDQAPDYGF